MKRLVEIRWEGTYPYRFKIWEICRRCFSFLTCYCSLVAAVQSSTLRRRRRLFWSCFLAARWLNRTLAISVLLLVIAGVTGKEKRMEGGARDIAGSWCCCSLVFAGREKEVTLPWACWLEIVRPARWSFWLLFLDGGEKGSSDEEGRRRDSVRHCNGEGWRMKFFIGFCSW